MALRHPCAGLTLSTLQAVYTKCNHLELSPSGFHFIVKLLHSLYANNLAEAPREIRKLELSD